MYKFVRAAMPQLCKFPKVRAFSSEFDAGSRTLYRGERSVNNVTLLGRVGSDAEARGSADRPVSTFTLATSEKYISPSGETTESVEWHRIAVFRPGLREAVLAIAKKGNRLYVSGKLKYSLYTKANGEVQRGINIIANDIIVVDWKRGLEEEESEDEHEEDQEERT